jgi:amino acid permease
MAAQIEKWQPTVTIADQIEEQRYQDDQDIYVDDSRNGASTTLRRGLNARQVSMIAIGGAIGTGLIIGTGKALATAG